jgi:sulfur relay (sulfurtransferase) complex TusBCD TusD component (DsrE family)
MQLAVGLETNDPERIWNAFRLANKTLDAGHTVETFLINDGVEALDAEHEKCNPHGVLLKYTQNGGTLAACGTCLDSRDLDADELRPRSSMDEYLRIVEDADKVLTFS